VAVNSPTTQDLWSACFGGGQFVAVGTGGTILTSPDGIAWSQRSSGVDLWLVGVCMGQTLANAVITPGRETYTYQNLFVAVGDRGTILTSPDGIAWTPRVSGTTQRLNGVAFVSTVSGTPSGGGSQRFVAVGEGGTVCISVDGLTWTAGNAGVSGWLRGVSDAFAPVGTNSGVYVGGQQGTVLKCVDGVNFVPVSFPVSSDIGDLAVSRGFDILAVGAGGLIATGAVGTTSWNIQSVGTSFYRGALNARIGPNLSPSIQLAVGSGGVIAMPVPGGAGSWMAIQLPKAADLFAVATNDMGTQVVVAGQGGTIWSSASANPLGGVSLTSSPSLIYTGADVTLQAINTGIAPTSYQWQFNGVPIAGATQPTLALHNIQTSQNGTYLCTANSATASVTASTQLTAQLTPPSLGLVDLSFDAHLSAIPRAILPLPDGRLLLSAQQTFSVAGQSQYGVARLNPDGSVDPTFRVGSGLDLSGTVSQFLLQPDGKVVIRGPFSTVAGVARPKVARFNADGSLDATFAPDTTIFDAATPLVLLADGRFLHFAISSTGVIVQRLTPAGALDATNPLTTIPIDVSYPSYRGASVICATDASGRVLVAANNLTWMYGSTGEARLACLQSDGTLDETFALRIWPSRGIGQLNAVQHKIVYVMGTAGGSPLSPSGSTYLGRLMADGSADLTYPEKRYDMPSANGYFLPAIALMPDGSAVLTQTNPNRLIRYDATGQLDRNFSAYYDSTITGLTPLPDGRLLATGSFISINGVPRAYLARLIPDTHYAATCLTGISVRANAGSGDQTLIVGISVSGSGQKTMLVRGVGPGLAAYGVNGTLADPQLTLFANSTAVLTNDNWSDGAGGTGVAALTAQVQDFPLTPGSKDAATIAAPSSGLYTMHITGHGSAGVALAEAYDADPAPADFNAARVVSFSARTQAGTGDQTLTAGFAVSGSDTKRLLIRAVGPGLTAYGVSGVLADPVLTLYQGNTVIATNDDWNSNTTLGSAVQTAAQQTGAFALSSSSTDAALLVTLPPGVYTAQVTGKNGTTGVALVEVYEVP
jgi:uncharacterized delta-60 repeat protein